MAIKKQGSADEAAYVKGVMARAKRELGAGATNAEAAAYAAKKKWVHKDNAAVKAYASKGGAPKKVNNIDPRPDRAEKIKKSARFSSSKKVAEKKADKKKEKKGLFERAGSAFAKRADRAISRATKKRT